MSIVASTYTLDAHTQVDGSFYVLETHIDSSGGEHYRRYLAPSGSGTTYFVEQLNRYAVYLTFALAEYEAQGIINGG